MNLLALFKIRKYKKTRATDFYQDAVNRMGREQLRGLVERGIRISIARI